MGHKPGNYNIYIHKGETFSEPLLWKNSEGTPYNLTGYTARLHMRKSQSSAAAFATLTTENGGIVLGGSAGTITLSMSAADTSNLAEISGVYDLELISGAGVVKRLMQGNVILSGEVTR